MDKINDGGPAFPMQDAQAIHAYAAAAVAAVADVDERDSLYTAARAAAVGGMTLRDYFAAKAPVAFGMAVAVWGDDQLALHDDRTRAAFLAVWAMLHYEWADAMLAARGNDRLDLRELVAALLPYAEKQIHADLYAGGVGMGAELELLRKARTVVGDA